MSDIAVKHKMKYATHSGGDLGTQNGARKPQIADGASLSSI